MRSFLEGFLYYKITCSRTKDIVPKRLNSLNSGRFTLVIRVIGREGRKGRVVCWSPIRGSHCYKDLVARGINRREGSVAYRGSGYCARLPWALDR